MGFKRSGGSQASSATKRTRKTTSSQASSVSGRGGRATSSSQASRRGQKRRNTESDIEDEEIPLNRRHVLYDDDEDDVQAEYREDGGIFCEDIWIPPPHVRQAHELKGERLIIEKVICENFKSYGGLKEMGPFHKSFSAIVGPNGNGKSNIIDALLFVFGYRASKIRCKKVSVLIHKSELLSNVTSCGVTVRFVKIIDEGEEEPLRVISGSEISVSRHVDLQNRSTYQLNGQAVQFHDVATFLKENGIDIVHNRFLILQGEVESISLMPPKQRNRHETGVLEFLEEVIGTKRYLPCLVALEGRVEELNFTREAKLYSADLAEKEKNELAVPVEKAKSFLREKNELNRNHHKLYQLRIYQCRAEVEKLEAAKKEAEAKLTVTNQQLNEIKATNGQHEKAYQGKEREIKQLDQEMIRLQKIIDSAEAQYTKVKEQIQRANTQRKKVMKEITNGEKDMEELEQVPMSAEKEIKILEKRRADLDSTIVKEEGIVEIEMKKIDAKVVKVSNEKATVEKKWMDFKKVRDEKKQLCDVVQSELAVMKEAEETELKKLEAVKMELEELQKKLKGHEHDTRSSFGNRIGIMEQTIREKSEEFQTTKSEEESAKQSAVEAQASFDEAKQLFENVHSNDEVYNSFFEEKRQGRLEGIYGRLRDLATIDEKYNIAATVASGLWDHWVVDTDTTGEEAIKFLRSKNLPVQNFQCLNKLQRYVQLVRKPFQSPVQAKRLFDLLKISKPELRAAFYKALGDTLVAETLEIGSNIAYNPSNDCRVTTLDGEVIDPSGQMTGGGRQKIIGKLNGRMAGRLGQSLTQAQFNEIRARMTETAKKYNDLCIRRHSLEGEIRTLNTKLREMQLKLDSSKTDVESTKKQIKAKENRLNDQEKKVKEVKLNSKVIQEKEKLIAEATLALESATKPCVQAEREVKLVESKLKVLQEDCRREVRSKLDTAVEQRRKVVEEFNKNSVALTNYEKNHSKLEKKLESFRNNQTRLENEMREFEDKKKQVTENAIEVNKEIEALRDQLTTERQELKALKNSLSEINQSVVKLEKDRETQQISLSNATSEFDGLGRKLEAVKSKMNGLEVRNIPEETVEPIRLLNDEELDDLDAEELKEMVDRVAEKLRHEKPNLAVLEQFQQKLDEFMAKVQQLDDITNRRDTVRNAYVTTITRRLTEFMEGFAIISTKLKEMFRTISLGGDAELELVDSTDPFSCGIQFSVRPCRKAWKKIAFLSGGEKTLASLALIFALHHFKPSPFYVMDEIDAALDFKNVSIIANYIKDRTKFTQFIIISLRSNMFELADSMLGVYKLDSISFAIHLGISALLKSLRTMFEKSGRPFPFEFEYRANSRQYRRQQLEKFSQEKDKEKETANDRFVNDISTIFEQEEENKDEETGPCVVASELNPAPLTLPEQDSAVPLVSGAQSIEDKTPRNSSSPATKGLRVPGEKGNLRKVSGADVSETCDPNIDSDSESEGSLNLDETPRALSRIAEESGTSFSNEKSVLNNEDASNVSHVSESDEDKDEDEDYGNMSPDQLERRLSRNFNTSSTS